MPHRLSSTFAARFVVLCAAFVVAGFAAATVAVAQPRFDFDSAPGSLPKTVVPSRYRLALDLDPARDDFAGRVAIDVEVRRPVDRVVVHARELTASDAVLRQGGATRALRVEAGPIAQSWSLVPADAQPIAAGRYTVEIGYRGVVHTSGVGLFRADHVVAGRPARMLATQLESIDARSVFPGFDEPAFRAVFELAVTAPRGLQVLSNMPPAAVKRRPATAGAARTTHRFQPTPPMPSYLLAVSVGRYDVLEGRLAGLPLRIFTAPGKRARARYAMEVTRQVVPFFSDYFGVPYALPKLDQLAVPSVRDGAMEDWGLISYSEDNLLFDPAASSPWTQRGVYNTVAHEIAHQWFGNLVTAASWEEIWLNEAFATWLADKATAKFNPGWHVDLEARGPRDRTMAGDAGGATRAIRSGPVAEASVFDVFDNITYDKGGAVLGMLEQWLGAEVFRAGLSAYMRERKFSNATAGDLWFHMAEASKRDVAAVAASWTDQPGFPLLTVEAACVDGQQTRLTLAQRRATDGTAAVMGAEPGGSDGAASGRSVAAGPGALAAADASRFASTAASGPASAAAPTATPAPAAWQVPVRIARAAGPTTLLLTDARQTFDLPGCDDGDAAASLPLVANAGGVGFYRVAYAAPHADALTRRFAQLAPADQVTLLSDTFALAQAGELPLSRWLAVTRAIPDVTGPARATLFDLAGSGFAYLDRVTIGTPTQAAVRAAGRRLLAPELARLGWDERPSDDAQALKLRGELIEHLAAFDDAPTIAQALRRFDAAEAGGPALPGSIRSQVLHAVGMHADRPRFDRLMARLKAAGGEEDRWIYASALAAGRDAERAGELLVATLAGIVPSNIAIAIPGMVSENSPFAEAAYAFTLDRWDALAALAGDAMFGRHNLLPRAAAGFVDPAQGRRLIEDQQRKDGAAGAFPAARAAARIAQRAGVRGRVGNEVDGWQAGRRE